MAVSALHNIIKSQLNTNPSGMSIREVTTACEGYSRNHVAKALRTLHMRGEIGRIGEWHGVKYLPVESAPTKSGEELSFEIRNRGVDSSNSRRYRVRPLQQARRGEAE